MVEYFADRHAFNHLSTWAAMGPSSFVELVLPRVRVLLGVESRDCIHCRVTLLVTIIAAFSHRSRPRAIKTMSKPSWVDLIRQCVIDALHQSETAIVMLHRGFLR